MKYKVVRTVFNRSLITMNEFDTKEEAIRYIEEQPNKDQYSIIEQKEGDNLQWN